jgi:uncharacterized protein involved in exopolysaccharide biosynthesis
MPTEPISTQEPKTLLGWIALLVEQWRVLFLLPVATVTLAVAVVLSSPPDYRATSVFLPEQTDSRGSGAMAGLASQLGLAARLQGEPNADFYVQLTGTRQVLGSAVEQEYRIETSGGVFRGNLIDWYDVQADGHVDAAEAAIEKLRKRVMATPERRSGLVTLAVQDRSPEMATAINRKLLETLTAFNQHVRQSRAAAERRFTGERNAEVEASLRRAERDLEQFSVENRRWEQSPRLTLEYNRLQRQVAFYQQLYTGLSQAYEETRINEVRDTPVLTIVDAPEGSARPVRSNLLLAITIAVVGGLCLALAILVFREKFRVMKTLDSGGYGRLSAALRYPRTSPREGGNGVRSGESVTVGPG